MYYICPLKTQRNLYLFIAGVFFFEIQEEMKKIIFMASWGSAACFKTLKWETCLVKLQVYDHWQRWKAEEWFTQYGCGFVHCTWVFLKAQSVQGISFTFTFVPFFEEWSDPLELSPWVLSLCSWYWPLNLSLQNYSEHWERVFGFFPPSRYSFLPLSVSS